MAALPVHSVALAKIAESFVCPKRVKEVDVVRAATISLVLVALAVVTPALAWDAAVTSPPCSIAREGQPAGASREPVAVWSQLPDLVSGSAYTSSIRLSDGYWAEAADDFEIAYPALIDGVEWWGALGPPEDLEYVIMTVYLNDATLGRSLPGALAYQETIHVFQGEEVTGTTGSDYRYTADLPVPFSASASTRYWATIQGVEQNGQWFWYESSSQGYWGEAAAIRSEFWGFPDWAPYSDLADGVVSFAFVLYADSTPVESTSWGSIKALFR